MTGRRIGIAIAVIASLIATGCGGRQAAVVSGGREVSITDSLLAAGPTDTLDFGRVRQGESVVRTIALRNGADRPMVILGAEVTCGCIEVDFGRKPVEPGQVSEMSIFFHTGGLAGPQQKPVGIRTSLGGGRYRIIVVADII